jgi:hypothetical protein
MYAGIFLRGSAIVSVTLLAGCVSLQKAPHPHFSSVLFSVKLSGEAPPDQQPTGIIVSVESKQGLGGGQFAFAANSRVPGYYTTFLARLDLPTGRYRLARLSATTANGAVTTQFDVSLGMLFDVRSGTSEYIGHIELTDSYVPGVNAATTPTAVIADAFESELPNFLHAWPSLHARGIERRAPTHTLAIPARLAGHSGPEPDARPQIAPPAPALVGRSAARLELRDAQGLPPQALRAFAQFLESSYPRAFTVAASGDTGMAVGGEDVIGRALRNCKRVQPNQHKASCQLFALDDTLLSSIHPGEPAPSHVASER